VSWLEVIFAYEIIRESLSKDGRSTPRIQENRAFVVTRDEDQSFKVEPCFSKRNDEPSARMDQTTLEPGAAVNKQLLLISKKKQLLHYGQLGFLFPDHD